MKNGSCHPLPISTLASSSSTPRALRGATPPRPAVRPASPPHGRPGEARTISTSHSLRLPLHLRLGQPKDGPRIAALRHDVYARELGQHPINTAQQLSDPLDEFNVYVVAEIAGEIVGFITLTPPTPRGYSVDKYVPRSALGFAVDDGLYEIRLLTVQTSHRRQRLAALLMYAAFRWVESHGGTRIVAIGRQPLLPFYEKTGLKPMGRSIQAGAVVYELLQAPVAQLRTRLDASSDLLNRLEANLDWQLPMPFRKPAGCFHGGAFFDAIGTGFGHLERRASIVNADVLDAWFPPSPNVLSAIQLDPGWLCRTSPPTDCAGLIEAIAHARGVAPANLLPGAGSSDLIFRAFLHWLRPESHVVLLDPTYGEYAHVLERVVGCRVTRVPLPRARHYQVDLDALLERLLAEDCDLLVLVNPNSPTGQCLSRAQLTRFLAAVPRQTRVWIDETYIDYVGQGESVEPIAARSENVIVCKSMSKIYALSGLRAAYLCAGPHQLEALKAITPPWIIGLPAQLAAVRALQDPAYYAQRYQETHALRLQLAHDLSALGLDVVPGCANFLLCHLPPDGPTAAQTVAAARAHNVFLRDAGATSTALGAHTIRVAVKCPDDNRRTIAALRNVLASGIRFHD